MKNATLIRYGTATAIGLVMSAALLTATSKSHRAKEVRAEGIFAERLAADGTQAMMDVDLSLAAMAQSLATTATANDGLVPGDRFNALAKSFFAKTRDTQGLVFFRNTGANQQAAEQLANPIAEGITSFAAGGQKFYLAPSNAAQDGRGGSEGLMLSAPNGRIPLALASGETTHRMLGRAIESDLPVASGLFTGTEGGAAPASNVLLGQEGTSGFWRFLAVRGADAEGRESVVGVLGAFVDATALFTSGNQALRLSGPIDAIQLSDPGTYSSGGKTRDVSVSAGTQGFVMSFPTRRSLPAMWWIFSVLGGLTAAAAALYTCTRENNARAAAEKRLALHKREFKKRSVELKRSEDRFRRLAESTNVIPWAADLNEGRFTYIGPQIERVSGYPAKSWASAGFWVDHVHPEDRQQIFGEKLKNMKPGEYATIEYRVRSADGRVIHMRNMLTMIASKTKTGEQIKVAQGYMLDITEMKTAQSAYNDSRRAAEEANRTKSEFLANMSHELRTPLNAVIGFAEVMKDEVFGAIGERYQEYAENIHASGRHLLSLINDVLDLSKIEAGKIELVEEETDISVVLSKCRQLLHERASQAGLHIRLEIPAPLPFIVVDGRRIKQVILNLMSNAVKFTAPGGRITLRAELLAPQGLKIAVSDTGIGMTKEEIDVAMEQFGQIDSELSRQHEGTGLGLPIARSLAELHGGSLEVESKKNVGTTVSLWLPLTRVVSGSEHKPKAALKDETLAEAG